MSIDNKQFSMSQQEETPKKEKEKNMIDRLHEEFERLSGAKYPKKRFDWTFKNVYERNSQHCDEICSIRDRVANNRLVSSFTYKHSGGEVVVDYLYKKLAEEIFQYLGPLKPDQDHYITPEEIEENL